MKLQGDEVETSAYLISAIIQRLKFIRSSVAEKTADLRSSATVKREGGTAQDAL